MTWDPATRYRLLLKLNNAIITKTTREDLFRALAKELHQHVAYDRLSINLYDEQTRSLSYFAAAEGIDPEGIAGSGSRPLAKAAIADLVLRSRQPVIVDDLSRYHDLSSVSSMIKSGLKATMAYPLVVRGRILGTIHFSFSQTPGHMSELTELLNEISNQVAIAVDNMLTHTKLMNLNENLEREKRFLIDSCEENYNQDNFFHASPAMAAVMEQIRLVAATDASVLITGETGTGKDFLARYIHNLSPAATHLFVKISCPSLAPSVFESELFGHAKGAFTGADAKRIGRFEMARGGSVFLDEIGELPVGLQAKLLQVLHERRFERVGDNTPVEVNCRIIAATNQDLEQSIREGRFRQDLFYRINTVSFQIPPLRERREEIPLLVEKLTEVEARRIHRAPPMFTTPALDLLCQHNWPGNVRELKNLIKRLLILRPGDRIGEGDVSHILDVFEPQPARQLDALADVERRHIENALTRCRGVVAGPEGAARLLGLARTTLQYRLKKHGLNPRDYVRGK